MISRVQEIKPGYLQMKYKCISGNIRTDKWASPLFTCGNSVLFLLLCVNISALKKL
jgi:hypothetical protein